MSIDIIMPVRNSQATVELALRSTLMAMSQEDSVLVLDDGSQDDTFDILERVSRIDSRVKVLRNRNSFGVSTSLNELLDNCTNEFVARMDGDDVCLPWRFRLQISLLRRRYVDFLFGGILRFGSFGALLRQPLPLALTSRGANQSLLHSNVFAHPTLIARRVAFENLGGYSAGYAEDYMTWVRAASHGLQMVKNPVPVVLYRVSESQTSRKSGWEQRAIEQVRQSPDWELLRLQAHDLSGLTWADKLVLARSVRLESRSGWPVYES